ncbi:MAG: non-canonical purine NTP pyrophosphatase [Elusimicrobia bacterium]|nr:non-canonical purine NTP pyrophosphatase [Elusimicrobiota bacterium]
MSRPPVRLVLATRNAHKAAEISRLLGVSGAAIASLDAFPAFPETVEDRDTLEGNAEKKAVEAARACGTWALADDSGLFVPALGGEPGVHSARWAGPGCSFADNCAKLLRELEGETGPKRAAYFRTVLALSDPEGRVEFTEGRLDGVIGTAPRGGGGFGYDPLFTLTDGRTLAELSPDEKNGISHRGRALRSILPRLRELLLLSAALWFAAAVLPPPARAGKTEPGQETIWDQIMAAQAMRGMRQGHQYIEEKKYDLALQEMRRAVAADPKNPVGYMLLGVAQYWNGQVDESIASYDTAINLDPTSAQAYLLLGISYAWKGDAPESEKAFRRATELEPTRADAQMNLGSIREARGDVPEALALFRKAVDLDKKNPLYRFQLGQLYRKLGRDADAAEQLREAVKLEPEYEDAMLELGCAEERLKEDKGAIATLKRAVSIKPGDSVARMRLARLQLKAGDHGKARATLADAFHLTPENGGAGLQLSVSYAGGKRAAKPGELPEDPKAKEPEAAALPETDPLAVFERNLRRVPLDQGALMKVDAVFLPRPKLVRDAPGEGGSLKKALARAHDGAPGAEGSPQAVRRDYALKPGDAGPRDEQVKKIMEDLRRTMREAPADTDARLGMNLTFTRPVPAGRGDAESPAKVSYQPRQVGNDMGLWVIGTGWMALVAEVLPESGEKPDHPDDADWWTATGLAYAAVGEGQRADSAFRRATELDGGSVPAWLGRGVSSVMIGDETGAVAALRKALEISPKNRAAADGLKWLLRPAASTQDTGAKK